MKPKALAIVKCQAHKKGNDVITKGNQAADEAARKASGCTSAVIAPQVSLTPEPDVEDLIEIQGKATLAEQTMWRKRGAKQNPEGLWSTEDGLLVAPTPLLTILISEAHGMDHCARGEVIRKIKDGFWSPYLQASVDFVLSQCEVCAQNNVWKGITTPIGHIPVPEGPFKHLVIDYVDMIKTVRGKRYMLVVIDRFSRWVEVVPSRDQGTKTVVKFLTNEVIPRLGIPTEVSSDNGSAFIQKVVKLVLQALRIKQRFGCVYHPQSQGMVERINGTLKAKLNKICADTKLNWVDALPLALMSYRMQTSRMTCLTPHEMLTGRPMPVPQWRGPYKGPSLEQLEIELKQYMQQLTMIHRSIYAQEKQKEPETVQGEGWIKPGDQVYLRVFRRKWNEPRREGPFTVTKASPTAVQVEGHSTWYHLNHCTRAVLQGQSGEVSDVSDAEEQLAGDRQGEQEADTAPQEFDQLVREIFDSEDGPQDPQDVVVDNRASSDNGDELGTTSCAPGDKSPTYSSADLGTISGADMEWDW
ncbi:uncharacterized protein [Hemitrygon akajei]|uniref:uncharacterized protein n=1 Tax=Hemitrygon akajei TaxID=2704970 RepID=UPI003BF9D46C